MKLRLIPAVVALGVIVSLGQSGSAQEFPYQIFERYIEPLAQQIGMPGLSALIVRNGVIEWERGYGYQDVEKKIAATPDTPYPIGGVTQAMTGVLMGVCIDRYRFDIDRKMREFVPAFPIAGASVRQVLAHASESRFQYDPVQFTALTMVVEQCSGHAYRVNTAIELLNRFAMTRSVPGLDLIRPEGQAARELFDPAALEKYFAVLANVAVPYRIDRDRRPIRSEMANYGLDASSGLVATVRDLYRFETAVDNGIPLSANTRDQMWSAAVFKDANDLPVTMPTGLGWFVQTFSGAPLVWTFGHIPDGGSALILKMPHKKLTLILLSNSDRLSAGYNLERGDVSSSPFVKIFLRLFL
jgi:CubicO group peptidase (beta-lactamase class C family)